MPQESGARSSSPWVDAAADRPLPAIPDHCLLRCIGRGSYGEVWLARNVVGTPRAIKIVYRDTFEDTRPYEREFAGIQKYEPLSRTHEGLKDLLQIGRNDAGGYFYCVMELADPMGGGVPTAAPALTGTGRMESASASPEPQPRAAGLRAKPVADEPVRDDRPVALQPESYEPRTLRNELRRRGRLPADECLQIGIPLAGALAHLHANRLVHRDIKPSNVIFVGGQPKLADIGLVTEVSEAKSAVGTPGYVPPEGPGTPQADIFSFGKLLYEIATGKDRTEFPAPLTNLGTEPDRELLHELNEVILRAAEPDPARRYPSMAALRAELLLVQAGESVRRTRALERRFRRFRRVAAIVASVVLIAGTGLFFVQRDRAARLQEQLELQRRLHEAAVERSALDTQLASEAVEGLFADNRPREAIALLAGQLDLEPTNHVIAERLLSALTERSFALPIGRALAHPGEVRVVRWSADGARVFTASRDGTARLWEVAGGGKILRELAHGAGVCSADLSSDSQYAVTGGDDGTARVWSLATGGAIGRGLEHGGAVLFTQFAPDGRRFVTASADGTARLWRLPDGPALTATLEHADVVNVAQFSPDGTRVVTACADGIARVWDAASGQPVTPSLDHGAPVTWAEFSRDGERIVTAGSDGVARVWDARTGTRSVVEFPHAGALRMAGFSPEGLRVLTASADGTARVWDGRTGEAVTLPMRHEEPVVSARFSPDGLLVVTASDDFSARIWDAFSGDARSEPLAHRRAVTDAEFSPDGWRVATASEDVTAQLWDVRWGGGLGLQVDFGYTLADVEFSRDAAWMIIGSAKSKDAEWGVVEVRSTGWLPVCAISAHPPAGASRVHFSPDGRRALAVLDNQSVWTWDVAKGMKLQDRVHHDEPVHDADFSPDGGWLVTASADGSARVWEAASGEPVGQPLPHAGPVFTARFSLDGRTVLTASADGTARLWRMPEGQPTGLVLRHEKAVRTAEFSHDGRLIVTASDDTTVRLWNAGSGQPVGGPLRHPRGVREAHLNSTGTRLVAVTVRGQACIWDPLRPRSPRNPVVLPAAVRRAEFSPNGERLVTVRTDGTARVWDADTAQPLGEPLRHDGVISACFRPDGRAVGTVSTNQTLVMSDLLQIEGPAPAWLPALARALALDLWEYRVAASAPPSLAEIRAQIQAGSPADGFVRWGRWFLGDRWTRKATPFGGISVPDCVEYRMLDPRVVGLLEVVRLQPSNSVAWTRLRAAALQSDHRKTNVLLAATVDHQICRLAEQQPDDRALLWAALETWLSRSQTDLGLAAMDRVLARQPDAINPWIAKGFLLWRTGRPAEAQTAYDRALGLARSSPAPPAQLRRTMLLNRASLLRRLGRTEEAFADYRAAWNIPPREASFGARAVDLSAFYNAALDEAWYDFAVSGNHCLESTTGWRGANPRQLKTDLRGLIQLTNPILDEAAPGFPREVTGIPVRLPAGRVCFVHATCGIAPEGSIVGSYVVHYADGVALEIPIRFGPDVRTWHGPDGCSSGPAPFQENKAEPNPAGEVVRLLSTLWTNPLPEVEIATVDFRSAMGPAAPLLIALTLEGSGADARDDGASRAGFGANGRTAEASPLRANLRREVNGGRPGGQGEARTPSAGE